MKIEIADLLKVAFRDFNDVNNWSEGNQGETKRKLHNKVIPQCYSKSAETDDKTWEERENEGNDNFSITVTKLKEGTEIFIRTCSCHHVHGDCFLYNSNDELISYYEIYDGEVS